MRVFYCSTIAILILTCTTYDKNLIYHRNFHPGKHALLRFDGYYADSNITIPGKGVHPLVRPVFFYANGSAYSFIQYIDFKNYEADPKDKSLAGAWGNYKISGDTIKLERFDHNESQSNYDRIILWGLVAEKEIRWIKRKFKNESEKVIDYKIRFRQYSIKPDSTENWTRKRKSWHK
ncbi:MAG TPA: hypothetical protein VI461_01310 [Chitinophagaceae bacterium]|nr:hypothetical protein [Chitinophagaceae bacterium]